MTNHIKKYQEQEQWQQQHKAEDLSYLELSSSWYIQKEVNKAVQSNKAHQYTEISS
jgi:hypothetical protein